MKTSRRLAIVKTAATLAACVFTSLVLPTRPFLHAAPQAQQPTFRTKIEIVQLDVSVLDRNRHPVRGLTQEEFTILEDGKPRKIVGFTAFDVGDEAPAATGWMRDVPPDVTTNDLKPETRLFVIVIDDGLIPQDPYFIKTSREIITSVIDKLRPEDLTAIVFTGDNRKTQDFTNDQTKLRAALEKFNPGLAGYRFGLDTDGKEVDYWFFQSAIRTLSNVAEYPIAAPNRRKVLFYISPGVPIDLADCTPVPPLPFTQKYTGRGSNPSPAGSPKICVPGGLPSHDTIELQQRTSEIFRRAGLANVTVNAIDPGGLGGMRYYLANRLGPINELVGAHKASMQQDFLAETAANTGGRTVMNTNDFEPGIRDIFAENSSYYLIGFEPASTAADGKLHRVQVKVNRPDVDVRTRSGYYAPEPEKPNAKKPPVSPEAAALAKSIGGLLPTSDLPMKVALAPFAVPGQRLATVSIVLGVRQPVPEAAAKSRITETTELQVSAFTPEGDPRGTQRHTARVTLRAGADGDAAYEVLGKIDLPAGRYRLRLAAHNVTSKKDGSVFADVVVPDYSNMNVSASPLILSASPGRVSAPKDLLASVLPLVPTAERDFSATDKVTALLRLYQNGQKPIERAQVAIRIRDARDVVVINDAQMIPVDRFTSAGQKLLQDAPAYVPGRSSAAAPSTPVGVPTQDRFANLSMSQADVRYEIPLSRLSAGPHLLTVEVTMGATVLRRDLRFVVR